jgi:hypothetical protein
MTPVGWSDRVAAQTDRTRTNETTGAQQMSRTKSLALRLAGLAAFALVLAAPFRWQ